jgi:hypothetical protein
MTSNLYSIDTRSRARRDRMKGSWQVSMKVLLLPEALTLAVV